MKAVKSKKIILSVSTVIILLMTSVVIMGTFFKIQDKIQRQMFWNYMEQIDEISNQITNTIHLEVQYSAHLLKSVGETLEIDADSAKESIKALKGLKNKGNYLTLGVISYNGDFYDTDGNYYKINMQDFLKDLNFLENHESYYVSDVVTNEKNHSKEIIIAVPLYRDKKMTGVIFGYYPLLEITEEVNITEKDHQFFQLIDTNGNYISLSTNKNSFVSGEKSLWEEMEKFTFLKGRTLEEIKKNIEEGKKGIFSFDYKNDRRYVSYTPLGINNWYIFSIFTRDELSARAREFQKISNELLFYLINFKIVLVAVIIGIAVYIYKIIESQNKNIEIKNQMFKMLARKTKDLFFEIHADENTFVLFNFLNEKEEISIPLETVSPENMLKMNYINKDNFLIYKELHKNVFENHNIENYIIQLKLDGVWKWFRVNTLAFTPKNIIGILEDFTEEKNQEFEFLKISEKSKYDFLTKLYNRETFEKEFNKFLNEPKDKNSVNALFLIDLDNFKEINDVFGHRMGDKVLYEAAKTLKNSVRNSDLLGRLGGDEFVLLIENASDIEAIHKIAQKLNNSLTKTYTKDNRNITISCSIGISLINGDTSFKRVYEKADKALYHVKYNGRNSYFIKD